MTSSSRIQIALISLTLVGAGGSPGQSSAPVRPVVNEAGATVPGGSVTAKKSEPLTAPVSQDTSTPRASAQSATTPGGKFLRRKGKAAESAPPVSSAADEEKPYVIGSLDVLEIKVWNDAKLSGIFDVRPDGMISLPLIGEMKADGLTVAELTKLVKAKLAVSVMEDPEVNIQVARINSKKFYIFGGCLRQGEFPLIGATTVLDAFASCGGFKDFANLKKIYILRGPTQRFAFNYKEVSQGKHMEQNIRLQNGDRIFVPE